VGSVNVQRGTSNPGTYIYGTQADQRAIALSPVMASMVANNPTMIQWILEVYDRPGFSNETSFGVLGSGRLLFGAADHGIY
jgi:hypothetical protein